MMISPDTSIEERKNKSYKELIIERDKLLKDVYNYEIVLMIKLLI